MPRLRDRQPTLADVARHAGVSTATVSRCLNAPERVSAATRAAVMAAVNGLGYAPNHAAKSLAASRSDTFGVIIPTMDNAVFARGVQAFQETLGAAGVNLLIASSAYSAAEEAAQIRTLVARGADALLLIGYRRDPTIYEFLQRRGVPTLVAWAWQPEGPCPAVGFDNRRAMRDMAAAVFARGHVRVAMISAGTADNDRADERVAGFRAAAAAAGIAPDALPVAETSYSIAHGREAAAGLLEGSGRPTAILCGNDVLAMGAMMAARDLGLSVPRELSITGFDDIELAEVAVPTLATVHVPHRQMGRRAAESLLAAIRDGAAPAGIELPTRLCLRDSLAPAPAGSA